MTHTENATSCLTQIGHFPFAFIIVARKYAGCFSQKRLSTQ